MPFLTVVLRVVRQDEKPHRRLDPKTATKYIFAAMWTPVIMLLLGGFTIAAALSKFHIAKMMATFVLSKAGTRPRTVLITNMFVAMILSMWISNVASPVLCFSIIQVRYPLFVNPKGIPNSLSSHFSATSLRTPISPRPSSSASPLPPTLAVPPPPSPLRKTSSPSRTCGPNLAGASGSSSPSQSVSSPFS